MDLILTVRVLSFFLLLFHFTLGDRSSETSLPAGGDDTWARAVKELGPMPPTYDETR